MAQQRISTGGVRQGAERAAASPWFQRLARLGYAAKGVVYLAAGGLSARAAFGLGGAATDHYSALHQMLAEPLGRLLLVLIAAGLVGYVLLRLVQAILDPEHKGSDAKGIARRVHYLISAIVYASLAWTALQLATASGGAGGNQEQVWAARLFELPLGPALLGLAGAVVIGGGLHQLYKGYRADFSEHFQWNRMSAAERTWVTRLGRLGLTARGIVQALIGLFMVQAALRYDPNQVQGSDGALQSLAQSPFGLGAVAAVALGLVAYGVYMLAAAWYSRLPQELSASS